MEEPVLHFIELPVEVIEATVALIPNTKDRLQLTSSCKRLYELGRTSTRVWAGLTVVLRSVAQAACFLRWLAQRRPLLTSLSLATLDPLSVSDQPAANSRFARSSLSSGSSSGSGSPSLGTSGSERPASGSASEWESESDSDGSGPGSGHRGGVRVRWGTDDEEELELARADDTCHEQFLLGALAGIPLTSLRCSFQQGYGHVELGGMLGGALPSLRTLHVSATDVQVLPSFALLTVLESLRLDSIGGRAFGAPVELSRDCLPPGLLALTVVHPEGQVVIPRCVARSSCAPQLRELCLVGWSAQQRPSEEGSYEGSEEEEEDDEEEEDSEGEGGEDAFCCTGLQRLTALTRLQLRAGRLKEVPRQLSALQQLRELCLSGNFRAGRVPQLASLSLTTAVDAEGLARLAELPLLTKLHLSGCNLHELPAVLPPSLNALNVVSNARIDLSTLPTSGCPLEDLALDLSVAARSAAHLSSLSTLRHLKLGQEAYFTWLLSPGLGALLRALCMLPRLECVWVHPDDFKLICANAELEALVEEARSKGVGFVAPLRRLNSDF